MLTKYLSKPKESYICNKCLKNQRCENGYYNFGTEAFCLDCYHNQEEIKYLDSFFKKDKK